MKRYDKKKLDQHVLYDNIDGVTVGVAKDSDVKIIEKDGFAFKNLSKSGKLEIYEDWRCSTEDRIDDLLTKMSIEDMAGLMLYSNHQAVSTKGMFATMFAGTYKGKSLTESGAELSDLTDQQKLFLEHDKLRHVLLTAVEDTQTAVKWSNNLQREAEQLGLGIPVNVSSDPRHTATANTEFDAGAGGDISKWPQPLGLAATFDVKLVERFGRIASKEYRSLGISTALSPQIDIATEPRWMRFSGTFGEDSKLSADLAKAYCEGFQETNGKWGLESVNAMVKHWPGGGSGEAGRDAHYAYGKYAVYPGDNFAEHLIPFTEGAFKLEKTKMASAVMPYYTISYNQTPENIANGYNKHILTTLLREKYHYDGVLCTDWSVTDDCVGMNRFIGGKPWGVEDKSIEERHYMAIMAGMDQFGGNNKIEPVLAAHQMGVKDHGKGFMRSRFEESARRLLRNIFKTGLFDNPYIDINQAAEIVGNPAFMQEGYDAQLKSVVMLKNKNQILPVAKRSKVYIPMRERKETVDWFGHPIPASSEFPVDKSIVEKYYDVVDTPSEADFAIAFVESPNTIGYDEKEGYIPISLQYRPYTAVGSRKESIAGGDPLEDFVNRSYEGKTNKASNEADLDAILDIRKAMGTKPVVVAIDTSNPTIVAEFEKEIDGLLIHFSSTTQALLDLISGDANPQGLLPFQMPKDMKTVEAQQEDVAHDMDVYVDETGHAYDFAFGMNFTGVIEDDRVRTYKK